MAGFGLLAGTRRLSKREEEFHEEEWLEGCE